MKNKGFLCIAVCTWSLSVFAEGKTVIQENDSAPKQRPNMIYILADDMGYEDRSCYGSQRFSTPANDRLAEEGIDFMQHYAGTAVCATSRSVLMTGQHSGYTPISENESAGAKSP